MTTVSFTDLHRNLARYLDASEDQREEIVVTRSKGRRSVILSMDDFNSLQETAYLLSSPTNRKHLEKSLREAAKGKTVRFKP